MAEELRMPVEVVQEYARGIALDLIHMLAECDGLDVVSVTANLTGGYPSVSWHGIKGSSTIWFTRLAGEEVPLE